MFIFSFKQRVGLNAAIYSGTKKFFRLAAFEKLRTVPNFDFAFSGSFRSQRIRPRLRILRKKSEKLIIRAFDIGSKGIDKF